MMFVNNLEGFKTYIKNRHWSSSNLSEHKLCDEIASTISDFQDEIAEIAQGIHGKIKNNELKPKKITVKSTNDLLNSLLNQTNSFYKLIKGDKYIGLRSVTENFIAEINKYKYLLSLALKESKEDRIISKVINESINKIINSKL